MVCAPLPAPPARRRSRDPGHAHEFGQRELGIVLQRGVDALLAGAGQVLRAVGARTLPGAGQSVESVAAPVPHPVRGRIRSGEVAIADA